MEWAITRGVGARYGTYVDVDEIVLIGTIVDIGTLMPRLHILPLWIPAQSQVVWEYVARAQLLVFAHSLT